MHRARLSRCSAILAALMALSGCVSSFGLGCTTDPRTGQTRCQGDVTPAPPPPPEPGERG